MLMMDFKASNTATIATIDKGSDRTFASAFFHPPASPTHVGCCVLNRAPARPPSEIYFESRGKCCKKLLRYNGYPNKVLLYPEEGWARSAASSYWTIAPCRWRRNRCVVEEVAGSRNSQGALLLRMGCAVEPKQEVPFVSAHVLPAGFRGSKHSNKLAQDDGATRRICMQPSMQCNM
uniref:Uncharacterized protein n=1 Tax=Anopheles dirus TaxID=7168 RepID=A0A182NPN4_9DIPT